MSAHKSPLTHASRVCNGLLSATISIALTLVLSAPAIAKPSGPEVDFYLESITPPSVQPSGPEIAAYSKNFGVSKAVATERLELQARGASANIGKDLEKRLGESYGGLWFDNEAGEYVVGLTSQGFGRGATRIAAVNELADAELNSGDFRLRSVDSSWAELTEAREHLAEKLSGYVEDEAARVGVDPRANAVVVKMPETGANAVAADIARSRGGTDVAVEARKIDEGKFELELDACDEAARYCSQPMRGGVKLQPLECTAGFRARGKSDGKPYWLTAGHCVKFPEEVIWDWATKDPLQLYAEVGIGTLVQWHFPGGDWAKIDATNTWADAMPWSMITYYGANHNHEYPINGEGESIVGHQACHTGITTGTSCGEILETEEWYVVEGDVFNDMASVGNAVGLCAWEGDSGGPVFASNMALGTLTASSQYECGKGVEMIYPEIDHTTAEANVSLTPVSGAPGAFTEASTGFPVPHQATITGYVYPNGLSTDYHFDYGTTQGYGSSTGSKGAGSAKEFLLKSETLTGLKGNTTYHYRLAAGNSAETAKGIDKKFTTPDWRPAITPGSATEVKAGHGTLNAQVNPQGSSTTYRFEWGKASEGFPSKVPVPDAAIGSGTSNVAVSQEITGLKGLTGYHWRVVASNEEGTITSATQSFTTPDWRPTATTEKQTGVEVLEEEGRATLHGKVNPKGFATSYRFEWGTQEEFEEGEYNNLIPVPDGEAGSGEANVSVQATIKGIKGQTTYHFRLVAENAEGKSPNPQDKSFTTPDWRPTAYGSAAAIKADEATLLARINPKGFATTYHIEWADQAEFEAEEYGHEIEGESVGSGLTEVEISKELSGLEPRRAYHFRVIAESVEGTRISPDKLFRTSTSGFIADEYPATLHGIPGAQGFLAHFGTISALCDGPSFEASLEQTGPAYETGAEILSTTSVGAFDCEGSPVSFSFEMNGCNFEFDPGYGEENTYEGEFGIGPPGCGPITLGGGSACPVSIPAQVGRAATYKNLAAGAGKVQLTLEVERLRYSSTGSYWCPQATNAADGKIIGSWSLEAEDAGGEPMSVSITPAFHVGPEVITEGTSEVGMSDATLEGSIDSLGFESLWGFQYGATTEYEESIYGGLVGASEAGPVHKSFPIEGLKPDTTYHYRMVGLSNNGGSYGSDRTFTTEGYHSPRFEASAYPADISGNGPTEEVMSFGAWSVACESSAFSGALEAGTAPLPLDAEYSGCWIVGAATAVSVAMNSCRFELAVDKTLPPHTGSAAVSCAEEGDSIHVVGLACSFDIPAQTPAGALAYENKGEGALAKVGVSGSAASVSYVVHEEGLCFLLGLKGGEHEDGGIALDTTLEAADEEGAVDLFVSGGESELGLRVVGEEAEEESAQPRLEADPLPAFIVGEKEEGLAFSLGSREVICDSASLQGGPLTEDASSFTLGAEYTDCLVAKASYPLQVEMNSCRYVFDVDNSGPPYAGSLGVQCAQEGDSIRLVGSSCSFDIPAQTPAGALAYENKGEGALAKVGVSGSAASVSYVVHEEGLCFLLGLKGGEHEDGGIDATMSLGGIYAG